MKSLTIHVDDALDERIRDKAASEGESLNKTVTGALKQAFGLKPTSHRAEFLDQCGVWSEQERSEFEEITRREIDPKDWK
jgi:hypothetical protein